MSYCVYHIKLEVNPGENMYHWKSVSPLAEEQEGLLFLSPGKNDSGILPSLNTSEFPKALGISNPYIQQLSGKSRTYWQNTVWL